MDGGASREIVLSRHTCIRYTFLHFMALSLCLNRETIQNQNICTLGWPQVYQQWTAASHQIMTAWVGSSAQQQLACKKTKRFYSCYNWFYVYVPRTVNNVVTGHCLFNISTAAAADSFYFFFH